MKFQVPQYIDIEDKLFGPLTFKQFIYLAGGGGIAVAAWVALPTIIAIIIGAPIVGLAVALAFYKVNNKPFIFLLESMFKYSTSPRLYLWKKRSKEVQDISIPTIKKKVDVKKVDGGKLKDIMWSIDVSNESNTFDKK